MQITSQAHTTWLQISSGSIGLVYFCAICPTLAVKLIGPYTYNLCFSAQCRPQAAVCSSEHSCTSATLPHACAQAAPAGVQRAHVFLSGAVVGSVLDSRPERQPPLAAAGRRVQRPAGLLAGRTSLRHACTSSSDAHHVTHACLRTPASASLCTRLPSHATMPDAALEEMLRSIY